MFGLIMAGICGIAGIGSALSLGFHSEYKRREAKKRGEKIYFDGQSRRRSVKTGNLTTLEFMKGGEVWECDSVTGDIIVNYRQKKQDEVTAKIEEKKEKEHLDFLEKKLQQKEDYDKVMYKIGSSFYTIDGDFKVFLHRWNGIKFYEVQVGACGIYRPVIKVEFDTDLNMKYGFKSFEKEYNKMLEYRDYALKYLNNYFVNKKEYEETQRGNNGVVYGKYMSPEENNKLYHFIKDYSFSKKTMDYDSMKYNFYKGTHIYGKHDLNETFL